MGRCGAAPLAAALLVAGCGGSGGSGGVPAPPPTPVEIHLQSPDFRAGGTLPRAFTCDGAGRSPGLRWARVPGGTRELAILVDDPDAPGGRFPHWTVWHLRPSLRAIPVGGLPAGARQAPNGFGKPGWGAPCPPKGEKPHRYVFTLVALDRPLTQPNGTPAAEARKAINQGAIQTGTISASYRR